MHFLGGIISVIFSWKSCLLQYNNYLCSVLVKAKYIFSCIPLLVMIYSFPMNDVRWGGGERVCVWHAVVLQEESNIVTKGLFDERCPKHWLFFLPSEWLSISPILSTVFSNHKDLSKRNMEYRKSLINMQDFWGREIMQTRCIVCFIYC